MSKGSVSGRNKEMAKYLKEKGIRRVTGGCPICHKSISLNRMGDHIRTCNG